MTIKCSKCENTAVYLRRHTAERLCRDCIRHTTIDRVRRTINGYQMLKEDDRIIVAISGGKDSAVLLDILYRLEENYEQSEIIPVTIDEGIRGYRDRALLAAEKMTASLGLKLQIYSFKSLFGLSLDEIVEKRDEENAVGACSYCGVLRRKAINAAAKELEADVVATGHNLDDEAQTIMMNMMRGDSLRILRTNRSRLNPIPGFVPRIKPVMLLTERDIVAYAHNFDLPYHDVPCPYAVEAYRNDLREFLNEMEHKRPGTLTAILRSGEAITKALEENIPPSEFKTCQICGSPTPADICKACRMLETIRKRG